jgi:hypothetical protein
MDATWKKLIWRQFGAAIDMLENAVKTCPENLWGDRKQKPEFWYNAYHSIFWLDLYLSDSADGFTPPPPYGLEELDPAGVLPPRVYSQSELLTYLDHCRTKCRALISSLTDEKNKQPFRGFEAYGDFWADMTVAERLLYTMRHVQHHAAQLNLALRQNINSAPRWVGKTKVNLEG